MDQCETGSKSLDTDELSFVFPTRRLKRRLAREST